MKRLFSIALIVLALSTTFVTPVFATGAGTDTDGSICGQCATGDPPPPGNPGTPDA